MDELRISSVSGGFMDWTDDPRSSAITISVRDNGGAERRIKFDFLDAMKLMSFLMQMRQDSGFQMPPRAEPPKG